ncbi:unnamed protein product [Acanthosepion pharaonis]|uniref:Uncharacterized protein n=1 Tax=Acanthosepion pharaonis TaxID=158019 RepID=A0A812BSI7_ACAPH|nr:unnamed protein product [Sepia pharaonis]
MRYWQETLDISIFLSSFFLFSSLSFFLSFFFLSFLNQVESLVPIVNITFLYFLHSFFFFISVLLFLFSYFSFTSSFFLIFIVSFSKFLFIKLFHSYFPTHSFTLPYSSKFYSSSCLSLICSFPFNFFFGYFPLSLKHPLFLSKISFFFFFFFFIFFFFFFFFFYQCFSLHFFFVGLLFPLITLSLSHSISLPIFISLSFFFLSYFSPSSLLTFSLLYFLLIFYFLFLLPFVSSLSSFTFSIPTYYYLPNLLNINLFFSSGVFVPPPPAITRFILSSTSFYSLQFNSLFLLLLLFLPTLFIFFLSSLPHLSSSNLFYVPVSFFTFFVYH